MATWKLTPSQLTFGFNCPCCFHANIRDNWKKPYEPFPSVFGAIDRSQRKYWHGQRTELFAPNLPPGTLDTTEKWVKSQVIQLPGFTDNFYISGKIDCLIQLDEGGYAIADFKTTQISKLQGEYHEIYARQLHLYAWAMEKPDPSSKFSPISNLGVKRLGLMAYEPLYLLNGETLIFERRWVEIERNDFWFTNFMMGILTILQSPQPPSPKPNCDWCAIRTKMEPAKKPDILYSSS